VLAGLGALVAVQRALARRRLVAAQRALVALALLSIGCSAPIKDTEGRAFVAKCEGERCALSLDSDAPPRESDSATSDFAIESKGRLLRVCPRSGGHPGECRALTCTGAGTCSALGGTEFVCESGLCQTPQRALDAADRAALCLAGTGLGWQTPEQRSRLTLADSCRPPCELPDLCRAP
jgi:hypothetical protein